MDASIIFSTAFLMSVTKMTSSEAVRAVVSDELEAGTDLCDHVEAELLLWECQVEGLVTERLRLGGALANNDDMESWVENRLEKYYTVRIVDLDALTIFFSNLDDYWRLSFTYQY